MTKKKAIMFLAITLIAMMGFGLKTSEKFSDSEEWIQLLDEAYADNWEIFIGVPHGTVTNLDGVDPNSDGKKGTPLGLNNDPKKVFTFKKVGDEFMLFISGEIYGALSSKKAFGNYHLQLQYKWGEKKWEPRLNRPRDSGILYHCQEPHARFWNVWMQSQEFQIEQGNVGDLYLLSTTSMDVPAVKTGKEFNYKKGADLVAFSSTNKAPFNHCNKAFDNEKPHGKWNTLDLICLGDTSLHIVNGKVVIALFNSRYKNSDDKIVPLKKGKIQIQSEGAEIVYKNIQIRSIVEVPENFKNHF